MTYKQQLGHVFNNEMHVCGYVNDTILIQSSAGKPMRKYKLYENDKGVFFNYQGKPKYVQTKEVEVMN